MRCKRERKIEEIVEAANAGGSNWQLDIEGIKINGENYNLVIINNPSLNKGVCHLEFIRQDSRGRDYQAYRILIRKSGINFLKVSYEKVYGLFKAIKSSKFVKKGDLKWEYSPHADSESLEELDVPFF
ncbi:MAG: hypothetical protein Q8N63_01585 [Nanoarchaeota archaeon]|nr:hypothetical protein [Nanoarchaeota archaeon]